MVRNYKRLPGTRNYKNYTEERLEEAIQKVTDNEMSISLASQTYGIPFGTLYNRYKGLHIRSAGGQTLFTHAEEKALLRAAATCGDWGFPLTCLDLRMIANAYLDKEGKTIEKLPDNLPGPDWAQGILKRHNDEFSQRVAANIKRVRALVSRESLTEYYDRLKIEVEGVPPSNIFNYDESNVSDDPGKKRCIYRRGVKYPERVMNFTKSCTTIMMCGSADGVLLPPYVIYKSIHLYNTWKENGIVGKPCCSQPCCNRGSRYNRTQSGWIDGPTFRDWFTTAFLPHANRLEGRKILIGDNLSTHLDEDILKMCRENNISFICFVPNSTHICQPLDVGFFRPFKMAWRKTLEQWKMQNPKVTTVPKDSFPNLLKQAIIRMDKTQGSAENPEVLAVQRNLRSSFEATGIYPYNKERVLDKLPSDSSAAVVEAPIRDVLTDYLKKQRYGDSSDSTRRKKKRLNVEPGKSTATLDTEERDNMEDQARESEPEEDAVATSGPSNLEDQARESEPEKDAVATSGPSNSELNEERIDNESDAGPSNLQKADDDYSDSDCARCDVPEVGKFILAKFQSTKGKKTYSYVCLIEDVVNGKIVVRGLKSVKKDKTKFRLVDNDISIIEEHEIIMFLLDPEYKDDCYIFPTKINVTEM